MDAKGGSHPVLKTTKNTDCGPSIVNEKDSVPGATMAHEMRPVQSASGESIGLAAAASVQPTSAGKQPFKT